MTIRRMALVDERWVEDSLHLRRVLGATRLLRETPVVDPGQAYGSVLRDADGQWRMYYMTQVALDPARDAVGCETPQLLAFSSDGLNWERPDLGLIHQAGIPAGNAIIGSRQRDAEGRYLSGHGGISGFCVLDAETTPHPAARARYTAMYLASPSDTYGGICLASSDDGLRWRAYPENPVIPGNQDTQNCLVYDPVRREYVAFMRPMIYAGMDRHANRKLARVASPNLVDWGVGRVVLDTDERDAPGLALFDEPGMPRPRGRNRQFQGMTPWLANGCYLGLAWLYDAVAGTFQLELVHSADGLDWRREATREPLIADDRPTGFHGKLPIPMASLPLAVGDEEWFYVSNTPYGHHAIAECVDAGDRATAQRLLGADAIYALAIGRDRWVGYEAGDREGELLTAPFVWTGGVLRLNLCIADGGEVAVAVEDRWARPVPDYHLDEIPPLTGPLDAVAHHLTFGPGPKTIVKLPPVGPIRLRFRLRRATLYGFSLEDAGNAEAAAAAGCP